MRSTHHLLIGVFFVVYAATFLPNLGVFNSLTWVGPFPLPMAWVLSLNAVNTFIVLVIYWKFFKPYALRVERDLSQQSDADVQLEEPQ